MAIDGSKCPEDANSTDCLLRSMLQLLDDQRKDEDAEIKWDPITFAFTLIIGLVATAFALATILQAVLVSGKGRRKSGQRAIGDWSKNTRKEWSWSDMSFQVTAQTPILRTHSLLCQIELRRRDEKRQRWLADDARSEKSSRLSSKTSGHGQRLWQTARSWFYVRRLWLAPATPSPAPPDTPDSQTAIGSGSSEISRASFSSFERNLLQEEAHRAAAAWISFFEDVGLDQVDLLTAHNGLRLVAADYLPDDLVAAPAYAEVGVILAAATTAGAQFSNLDAASRFPTIFGRGFQFDFRQHPILGVVGAYSRYEKRDGLWESPIVEELEVTLVLGRGIINVQRGALPATPHLTCFRLLDYTGSARSDLRACLQNDDDLADDENANPAPMWFDAKARMAPYDFVPFAALLLASTPDYVPALFPKSVLRTPLPLTTLALGGCYWARTSLDAFVEPHLSSWPETSDAPPWRQFVWFDFDMPRKGLSHEESFSRIGVTANSAFFMKCAQLVHAGVSATLGAREREAEADAEEEAAAEAAASASEEGRAEAVKRAQEATLNASRAREARREATRAYETAKDGVKGKAARGYLAVLQLCLKLLHRPEDFEQWFLKASSGTRRALRCATLQQMQQVDAWLNRHGRSARMKQRAIALNTLTAVLSKAEEMVKSGRLSPLRETVGARRTDASVRDAGQKHDVLDGQCRCEDVATLHHSDLLQTLRNLLDDLHVDDMSNTTREGPVETPFFSNPWDERIQRHGDWLTELTGHQATYRSGLAEMNLTLENLGAVVVSNSEAEDGWPLWNRFHACRDEETRDIDDIIIYRTLMMYILFITAQDSSEIVESGLWDHVVPII